MKDYKKEMNFSKLKDKLRLSIPSLQIYFHIKNNSNDKTMPKYNMFLG